MAGKLITLPLRASFLSAHLLTRVAGATTERVLTVVGRTIGAMAPSPSTPRTAAPPPPTPPVDPSGTSEALTPRRNRKTPSVGAVSPLRPPESEPETVRVSGKPEAVHVFEEPEAVHVSEEPELVREVAEPGAEDGAGATITVAEPWNGYARMSAKDVIARARAGNPAELAAVRLYESRHRSRQTVLAAVDRQLKLAGGGAPA
jgi:hypothetical protein